MSITLIIPVRNRTYDLQRLLNSLDRLVALPDRIIIVDDASIAAVQFRPGHLGLEVVRVGLHRGTPFAKNVGLNMCDTKYIWFLDSDTEIVKPEMLEKACRMLDRYDKLGVIGGEFRIGKDGTRALETIYTRLDGSAKIIYRRLMRCWENQSFWDTNEIIPTSNFIARTALLKDIGGFVETMYRGEDSLASIMIHRRGFDNRVSTDTAVVHHCSAYGRAAGAETLRQAFECQAFLTGAYGSGGSLLSCWGRLIIGLVLAKLHRARHAAMFENYEGERGQAVTEGPALGLAAKLRMLCGPGIRWQLRAGMRYARGLQ